MRERIRLILEGLQAAGGPQVYNKLNLLQIRAQDTPTNVDIYVPTGRSKTITDPICATHDHSLNKPSCFPLYIKYLIIHES